MDVADSVQDGLCTNLKQFNVESCQHRTLGRSTFNSSECISLDKLDKAQKTFKYREELTLFFVSKMPSRPSLKTESKTVRDEASCSKKQFCIYCQKSNTKIARHLERMHSNETDVAYALSFPKRSKRRHALLEKLRKKGNYQHNIEVLQNGNGDIVLQKQTKRKRSAMEYLPCQYCLAFFLREGLGKHEYSCRRKMNSHTCLESLEQLHIKHESGFQPTPELNAQSLVQLQSARSRSLPNLVSSLQPGSIDCSELLSSYNPETTSFSSTQSSPESYDQTDLKSSLGPCHGFSQPCPKPFLPDNSDLGQAPTADFSDEGILTSSPEHSAQSRFEANQQSKELSSPAAIHLSSLDTSKAAFELCLPFTCDPGLLPYHESSPSHLSVYSCIKVLRSSPETSLPRMPEYCSIFESNNKTTLESCLESSMVCTDVSSSANLNAKSSCQPIVCQMSSLHSTQPSFESCILASVGCDLMPLPSPELCNQTTFKLSHESTLESISESCTQAERSSPYCSPKSYHQTGEHNPDLSQKSFELCLSPSPETSPLPHSEAGPSPSINFESCFEPIFQSSSETRLSPNPESFQYQGVEFNMKLETSLASRIKCSSPPSSSPQANIESISKISSASSHSLDTDASSELDCVLINGDSSVGSPTESLAYPKSSVEIVDVDCTSSLSCVKASSLCEHICSTSSILMQSQQISLNKTTENEKSRKKR